MKYEGEATLTLKAFLGSYWGLVFLSTISLVLTCAAVVVAASEYHRLEVELEQVKKACPP